MNDTLINIEGLSIAYDRTFQTAAKTKPVTARFGRVQTDITTSTTTLVNSITLTGTETVDDAEATTGWSTDADNALALNSSTFKEGSNALNLTKTGTTISTCTTEKTVTSRDFTDKFVHLWLYINTTNVELVASGTAVELRFGSDTSNYWYKQYTKTEFAALQVGNWSDLYFDDSESSTGSPVVGSCDTYKIILTLTGNSEVWSVGDCIFDFIRVASDDDYTLALDSGFPTNDTSNYEQTRQYTVPATSGNGYNFDSLQEENSDSPVVTWGPSKFPDESKSSTDRFIFIVVDRLVLGGN